MCHVQTDKWVFFVRDLQEIQELNHIVDDWNPGITTKPRNLRKRPPASTVFPFPIGYRRPIVSDPFPKISISNGDRPYLSRTWFLTWDIAWWVLVSVATDEKNDENDLVIRSKSGRAEKTMSSLWVEVSFLCLDFCATPFPWGHELWGIEIVTWEIGLPNCSQESGSRNTQSSSFVSDVY